MFPTRRSSNPYVVFLLSCVPIHACRGISHHRLGACFTPCDVPASTLTPCHHPPAPQIRCFFLRSPALPLRSTADPFWDASDVFISRIAKVDKFRTRHRDPLSARSPTPSTPPGGANPEDTPVFHITTQRPQIALIQSLDRYVRGRRTERQYGDATRV